MKINSLITNPFSKENSCKTPSFKKADFFVPIKQINGMVCGCCGKKVLSVDTLVKAQTPLGKPLGYIIEKGGMDFVKKRFPAIWDILESFAQKYPKNNLDEIVEISENYSRLKYSVAEEVGLLEIKDESKERIDADRRIGRFFYDMIDHGRAIMKGSSTVMKAMLPLKPFLTGTKKEVFEQFEIYARKYPKKRLSEIVKLDEVRKFHEAKNILQRAATREKMDYHFDNIRLMVKKKNPAAVEQFDELKRTVIEMFRTEKDPAARLSVAKDMYSEALSTNKCEKLIPAVMQELEQLPETFVTLDSFFASAAIHKANDSVLLSLLFSPILATEEHVVAVSQNGTDRVENKIVLCRECNAFRYSKPYSQFIAYHPDMPENLQKQIDLVVEEHIKGNLPENLRFYPVKIAKTLKDSSKGKINLNIDKYCEYEIAKSVPLLKKYREEIKELREKRDKKIAYTVKNNKISTYMKKSLSELNEKIIDLKDKIFLEENIQSRIKDYYKDK
ncbi:MAG: hypothetical protein E7Z93_02120 [Cyanobacteria bacterium SIG32]|nr:hypothetical protein [Cyanobacteria bacterium SIG32]